MYIQLKDVSKAYGEGAERSVALDRVDLTIEEGCICTILGPSGSGKSTLLNVVGGLDQVDGGRVEIDGQDIAAFSPKQLAEYRRAYLGFVFQFYNLVPNLTVKENVQVCAYLSKSPLDVDQLLARLGMDAHRNKFPAQLSGGQQQRCAIARAVAKNPRVLLCDEPTGALDYKSSKEILGLLEQVNREYGVTILMVTHNLAIREMAHQVVELKDGAVVRNTRNEQVRPAADIEW